MTRSTISPTRRTRSSSPPNWLPSTRLWAATMTVSILLRLRLLPRPRPLTTVHRSELFVDAPHESLSYIWQVFGCRHSLEPTDSDDDVPWNFDPPTFPALTLRGFVRWESIQILLTPDEHVPFIIYAIRNWNLKNPDTGEPFPADITAAAFPSEPDPEITLWYESCGEKLRKEATPRASPRPSFPTPSDRVHAAFSHVRAPGRAGTPDYFSHHRSVPFAHVSPGHAGRPVGRGAGLRVSPERMERNERMRYNGLSPQEERARRRSFSDYPSPQASPNASHSSPHLHPPRPTATRRHSHPRRVSTDPDESESDGDVRPPFARRGSGPYASGGPHRSPRVVPRFVHIAVPATGPPGGASPDVPSASPAVSNARTEGGAKLRPEDRVSPTIPGMRRKGGVEGAKDWAKEKFSSIFPGPSPSERPRKSPGSSSGNIHGTGGGSHDSLRLGRSRSYDDGNSDSDSEYERERRRRRRAREREKREREAYERDRERERPSRRSRDELPDWDQDPRPRSRRDRGEGGAAAARYLRRPDNPRRTSSHADVDRLDRERIHRYEFADERRRRGSGVPEERSPRDRTASPVIKGVGGRRYPAPPDSPPP